VRLGGRAERLARFLIVRKTRRCGRERNREITAVACPNANGAIGAGLHAWVDGRGVRIIAGIVAEQVVQEVAGALLLLQGRGVLRSAVVLCKREQHGMTLIFAFAAAESARTQALQVGCDLIEISAHLLNLV